MVCYTTCALATGFIGSSVALMFNTRQNLLQNQFVSILDEKQKEIYFSIVQERYRAYIIGTILGLILSTVFFFLSKQNNLEAKTIICSVILIIGLTQYFYYRLVPKSQWMLNHLTNQDQVDKWLEIYKYMSNRCHTGFAIGLVGYGLLAWANI